MSSFVNLVVIPNPFQPTVNVCKARIAYEESKAFSHYMGEVDRGWVASLNGEYVDREEWELVFPKKDDLIIVSAVPYGGGNGKGILRIVAMVAATYFLGPGSAFASGFGQLSTVVGAGAMIGASLVINAVLPPPTPDVNDDRDISDSPTYGQDTAQNTSDTGIPIPLVYGKYRMAGNIIGSYVENVNDEQFLYVLYNAGEGEIAGIEDIQVNRQPISNFSEVSYEIRLGTENQSAIGWFDNVRRQFNVNSIVRKDEWRTYTFRDLSDRASLELVFQRGLYGINRKDGKRYSISVSFEVQYRPYYSNQNPEDNWQPLPWISNNGSRTTAMYTVSGKQTSAVRRTIKTDDLGENSALEIRIRRLQETDSYYLIDQVTLATVTEISKERVRYKHTALLGLKIRMTEQLNRIPNVTYINKGLLVNVWDNATNQFVRKTTDNPAWISYDILTHERYGAGISQDLIRIERFKDWGRWCQSQKLKFNGVLDTSSNAFEILEPITRLGHAKLFTVGTRVSVSIERKDYPVMLFGQANIIKGSFSINWMSVSERANEVEVTYYDENNNYEASVVKVYDEKALANGELQRPSSFSLIGCTSEADAYYEGLLAINYNKYITQTYSFKASVDAIACTLGSVVYVQHDMPQWGYSGRLSGMNTLHAVNIDIDPKDMTVTPNAIMVHHSAILRGEGKMRDRYDNVIEVDAKLSSDNVDRIIISGRDYPVTGVERKGNWCRLFLEEHYLGFVGEMCEIWETDVFEERAISSISGKQIIVDQKFSAVPEKFNQYLIGTIETIKKKARILSIDYADDHTRSISAIEYNESVYDRNTPFSPSPVKSGIGKLVDTELSDISEELIQIGKSIRPRLTITYANTSTQYQTTQVFVSTNGSQYDLIGTNRRTVIFESEDKAKLLIKLVAIDSAGMAKSMDIIEPIEYTVLGKTAPPANIENFEIAKKIGGIELSWDANNELDIDGYEIRSGSSWDDGDIVTQALSSTVLFVPITEPDTYEYMICAVDTSGNRSKKPTYARIELVRPERVFNFNAVQHIDKILMQWERPKDRNITSFWVREGESWSDSFIHGSVTGTSFEIPAEVGGTTRTFWIKAVDIIGIESRDAVFANTAIASLPYRNMIYEQYHGRQRDGITYLAKGDKIGISGANPIKLDDRVSYGEYLPKINLPYKSRARNTMSMEVGVSVTNSETWAKANYSWDADGANSRWAGVGDPEKIDFQRFIALSDEGKPQFYPNTKYFFSLNKKLTCDISGIKPKTAHNVVYEDARYGKGVEISPTTSIVWDITSKPEWTLSGWMKVPPQLEDVSSGVAVSMTFKNAPKMYVEFSAITRSIIVQQVGEPDLFVRQVQINTGDVFFVAISQKNDERTLRVRNLSQNLTKKATLKLQKAMTPSAFALGFN